jgi:hypothetical protein
MHRIHLVSAALCVVAVPLSASAQSREVIGTVREAATGQPVPDAGVGLVGQEISACTNTRGEYRLRVPAGEVPLLARTPSFDFARIDLGARDTTANFGLERLGQPRVSEVVGLRSTSSEPLFIVDGVPLTAPDTTAAPSLVRDGSARGQPPSSEPLFMIDGVVLSNAALQSHGGQLVREDTGAN